MGRSTVKSRRCFNCTRGMAAGLVALPSVDRCYRRTNPSFSFETCAVYRQCCAAMAISVLMVCLGNICRSPMAEGALRAHAELLGLELHINSAGTGDWHVGNPPDARAQHAALECGGVDISGLRARQVCPNDFHLFDHVLAMDRSNLRNLRAMRPSNGTATLGLLLEHLPGSAGQDLADPYYGKAQNFADCWAQVDAATRAFAKKLL